MASRSSRPSRSRQEFDQFVGDSVDGLLRTAYLIAWDFAAAEDLVQECLLRVARQWPRVRAMAYPTAYARQILVHLALDDGRRRTRHRDELAHAVAHPVAEHEDDGAVRLRGREQHRPDEGARGARAAPARDAHAALFRRSVRGAGGRGHGLLGGYGQEHDVARTATAAEHRRAP